jgi:hypothetical protein
MKNQRKRECESDDEMQATRLGAEAFIAEVVQAITCQNEKSEDRD